jgi:hypothetical protein
MTMQDTAQNRPPASPALDDYRKALRNLAWTSRQPGAEDPVGEQGPPITAAARAATTARNTVEHTLGLSAARAIEAEHAHTEARLALKAAETALQAIRAAGVSASAAIAAQDHVAAMEELVRRAAHHAATAAGTAAAAAADGGRS